MQALSRQHKQLKIRMEIEMEITNQINAKLDKPQFRQTKWKLKCQIEYNQFAELSRHHKLIKNLCSSKHYLQIYKY